MTRTRNLTGAQRLFDGPAADTPGHDEHIHLDDSQKKVEEYAESENTSVFTFNKEDHRLGILISQRLLMRDHVKFAAYQVEHPHADLFKVRVSTDGSVSLKDAAVECCTYGRHNLGKLENSFQKGLVTEKAVKENLRKF